jgi:Raf kinase inhibitor-like YbhB/YbcL family protein
MAAPKVTTEPITISLVSPEFGPGEPIPKEYTADGRNVSPPLRWDDVPSGAQSLALVCEDPDAPSGTFTHWIAYNLPADARQLGEALPAKTELPDGTRQGANDFNKLGYGGPAPPRGRPHRYVFRLHALDTKLDLPGGATRQELAAAMANHVIATGEFTGSYGRS